MAAAAWKQQYSLMLLLTAMLHGLPSLRSALQRAKSAAVPSLYSCAALSMDRLTPERALPPPAPPPSSSRFTLADTTATSDVSISCKQARCQVCKRVQAME
jgi:hypothetical protein